jgi:HSP20 family protein
MTNREVVTVSRNGSQELPSSWEKAGVFIAPQCDVYETPDAFILQVDLPGATKDSMVVRIEDGTLTIDAPIQRHHRENATLLVSELQTRGYHREFRFGSGVDPNRVEAYVENGVLSLKVHKTDEARAREVPIK